MKKIVLCFLTIVILTLLTCSALALVEPDSFYNSISWTWSYNAPATSDYNCLAYAIGNTTSWIWPWSSSATRAQVDSWLGYWQLRYTPSSSYSSGADIVAYGPSLDEITHFSRIISSSTCRAKWGALERFTHYSLNPYYSGSSYGSARRYYTKY